MKEAVKEAVKIFCENILGLELENAKTLGNGFYGASIPICEDGVAMEAQNYNTQNSRAK